VFIAPGCGFFLLTKLFSFWYIHGSGPKIEDFSATEFRIHHLNTYMHVLI
jgi:hypothetical protein